MKLESAEKYITKVNGDINLFQIPNTLIDVTFDIAKIDFLSGPSPLILVWAGSCQQPALARQNSEDFYMSYNMCNRLVSNQGDQNSWINYPPDPYTATEVLYCDDGGKYSFFYFTLGDPQPVRPNEAANLTRNNKSMTVSKLTIFDKEYKYGALVTLEASFEGYKQGEGTGKVVMYYKIRTIPLINE